MKRRYCGESAGFLRSRRAACEERHQASLRASVGLVRDAAVAGRRWSDVSGEVERALADGFVGRERVRCTGGSSGVSFRVARGVYLRTGGFRGQRRVAEEREHADDGIVAVTTKHLLLVNAQNVEA